MRRRIPDDIRNGTKIMTITDRIKQSLANPIAIDGKIDPRAELTEVLSVAGLTPVGSGGKVGGLSRCRKSL